jgi:hypothetical protein
MGVDYIADSGGSSNAFFRATIKCSAGIRHVISKSERSNMARIFAFFMPPSEYLKRNLVSNFRRA